MWEILYLHTDHVHGAWGKASQLVYNTFIPYFEVFEV